MGRKSWIGLFALILVLAVFSIDSYGGISTGPGADTSQPRIMLACGMMGMGGMNMTGTGTNTSTAGMGGGMGCMGQNMNWNLTDTGKSQGTPPAQSTTQQQQGGASKGTGTMPGMTGMGQTGTKQ